MREVGGSIDLEEGGGWSEPLKLDQSEQKTLLLHSFVGETVSVNIIYQQNSNPTFSHLVLSKIKSVWLTGCREREPLDSRCVGAQQHLTDPQWHLQVCLHAVHRAAAEQLISSQSADWCSQCTLLRSMFVWWLVQQAEVQDNTRLNKRETSAGRIMRVGVNAELSGHRETMKYKFLFCFLTGENSGRVLCRADMSCSRREERFNFNWALKNGWQLEHSFYFWLCF